MTAIDTNVPVYAFDRDDPVRQQKAKDLISNLMNRPEETLLLWQVAVEFLNCLRRWESKGKITPTEVEAYFHDVWTMFPLQLPMGSYIDRSFDLRRRYMLSHWDSLLLAACQEAGVTRLYSEDLQNGATYDGVTVINPFV